MSVPGSGLTQTSKFVDTNGGDVNMVDTERLRRLKSAAIDLNDAEQIKRKVHEDILERLELQSSEHAVFKFDWFKDLLPSCTTPQQCEILKQFLIEPLLLSGDDLRVIIPSEQTQSSGPVAAQGENHYYYREWQMKCGTLLAICDSLTRQGHTYEELQIWRDLCSDKDVEEEVYVRYVGGCHGTAYSLYEDRDDNIDLKKKKRSGILAVFHRELADNFPKVAAVVTVWRITNVSIDIDTYFFAKCVERYYIALFNHKTLLNRQRGWKYINLAYSSSDVDLFKSFSTDFRHTYRENYRMTPDSLLGKLRTHFFDYQSWAAEYSNLTGTRSMELTDKFREVLLRQAMPEQVKGQTIFLAIMPHVSLQAYLNEEPYFTFNTKTLATNLVRDLMRILCKAEAVSNDHKWCEDLFNPEFWCCVNLFNVPFHRAVEEHIGYLQDYLLITRPLVVAAFSLEVNNILKGDFIHKNGVPSLMFLPVVGIPTIQHYDGLVTRPVSQDDQDAYIVVPHFNPEIDNFGRQLPEFRDLCLIIMMVQEIINEIVLQNVLKNEEGRMAAGAICLKSMEDYRAIQQTDEGRLLMARLDSAKDDMLVVLRPLYDDDDTAHADGDGRPLELAEPQKLSQWPTTWTDHGMQIIQNAGLAEGEAGSVVRRKQVDKLWAANILDFHHMVPHDEDRKVEWETPLLNAPEGQHLLLHAISLSDDLEYLKDLFDEFARPGSENCLWLQSPADRASVLTAANRELQPRLDDQTEVASTIWRGKRAATTME